MMRGRTPVFLRLFFYFRGTKMENAKKENKENLISSQPYFVMDADGFCQRIQVENGISHFFSFSNRNGEDTTVPLLVDSCCNIIFEYRNGTVRSHFIGITVEKRTFSLKKDAEYFGVRLQPGALKFIQEFSPKELVGKVVILDDLPSTKKFCAKMAEQKDFDSRVKTFLEEYENFENTETKKRQTALFKQLADLIIQRKGKIRVKEIEDLSGYTSRYINKIFENQLGMNSKQFCHLVKFQFMLHDINKLNFDKLTSFANDYDFYDQSHFIHEFKEFAGKTPKEYKKEIESSQYYKNVRDA